MIPAYNCAFFLKETLLSVLAQDPGEDQMQIEVVDDASTDADVAGLVATLGKGRVSYYRQPHNVGSLRNFETCLNRSRGYLVHLLHGDDRVRPGFYTKMGSLFEAFPTIGAAACRYAYIDAWGNDRQCSDPERPDDGLLDNWLIRIAQQDRLQYVSMVVKRSVYEHLGGFTESPMAKTGKCGYALPAIIRLPIRRKCWPSTADVRNPLVIRKLQRGMRCGIYVR
ncbi:glycosyltransferase family 2 protein [Spirosoma sp.]|uniref:glycosyltransferase family 2 protein n=1 Tax=Spirosoma sp. TaxID=1899569 RepID=UPI0026256169|nr:glycosyltransferase family 2 protein [Spirosoma sp.]MCX6216763.1 glycosyltransferase family 2 protein [Spirosoma sp.]